MLPLVLLLALSLPQTEVDAFARRVAQALSQSQAPGPHSRVQLQVEDAGGLGGAGQLARALHEALLLEGFEPTAAGKSGHRVFAYLSLRRGRPLAAVRILGEGREGTVSAQKLLVTVENAVRLRRLEEENVELRRQMGDGELLFRSPAMQQVASQVELVAPTDSTVCILGETGVGKELVARAIHRASPRRDGPFIQLNCAAVPAELIESKLFGHEKGSFTGAVSRHIGKFEAASGGTLFLDEIGDMPAPMQAKLLRVLQERQFERSGSHRMISVDVRVVTATNKDLRRLIAAGQFREDLLHRIYVFPIAVPPLRERLEDVPLLAEHFAREIALRNNWKEARIAPEALERLVRYGWPGNVRELRNVVERALILARGGEIAGPLVDELLSTAPGASGRPLKETMEEVERQVVLEALEQHGYQIAPTARTLGLERSHFYKKCRQLSIDLRTLRPE